MRAALAAGRALLLLLPAVWEVLGGHTALPVPAMPQLYARISTHAIPSPGGIPSSIARSTLYTRSKR